MCYEIRKCTNAYCGCGALNCFTINGKDADYTDFGELTDISPDTADKYGCGNMSFVPYKDKDTINEIISKYGITEDEFYAIIDDLSSALYIGKCNMCS